MFDAIPTVNPELDIHYYEWSRQFENALCTWDLVNYIYPSDASRVEEEMRNECVEVEVKCNTLVLVQTIAKASYIH